MLTYDNSESSSASGITPLARKMLGQASFWARFIAILGLFNITWGVFSFFLQASDLPMPGSMEWRMAYNFLGFWVILSLVAFLAVLALQIYFYAQTLLFGNEANKVAKASRRWSVIPTFKHLSNSFWAMAIICVIATAYLVLIVFAIYQRFWMFL